MIANNIKTTKPRHQAEGRVLGRISYQNRLNSVCYCCSVTQSCMTLCDPRDCSMPGFLVFHCLWDFAQTHVPWVNNASHHLILITDSFLCHIIFVNLGHFFLSLVPSCELLRNLNFLDLLMPQVRNMQTMAFRPYLSLTLFVNTM